MIKYKMELKPVKAVGLASLPDDKKQVFQVSLRFVADMLSLHEKIHSAQIQPDLSIIIEAEQDMEDEIQKLHGNAILTKIA